MQGTGAESGGALSFFCLHHPLPNTELPLSGAASHILRSEKKAEAKRKGRKVDSDDSDSDYDGQAGSGACLMRAGPGAAEFGG